MNDAGRALALATQLEVIDASKLPPRDGLLRDAAAELRRMHDLISNAHIEDFLEAVRLEAAHQRQRWGSAHDREKSAEHWYWLVGYLAGKALRAAIDGDQDKALHHTISSAAALSHWHAAVSHDKRPWPLAGRGVDVDLASLDLPPTGETEDGTRTQDHA